MGSYDEFKALADAAFAKMILKPREQEVPDPEAPEFTQLVAFLDDSDQREEFLQKLMKVCTKRFSRERGPEMEFLVTCSGDPEVFNVGYGGFWLLSLLEAGKENVTTILQSFKIGRLGPIVYMGVWGDQEILGRISSHVCRQQQPLAELWIQEVHCLTGEDALALTQMLENCEKFEISHLYFYFNDWPLVAEFWTALLNQLKRFPVKKLDTFKRGLLGARMEDLKEIWESCILEELKVGSTYVELGELEGWQRIEELVAKEEENRDQRESTLEGFLARIEDGQGASCPAGFPLKRVKKRVLHWGCNLCGSVYAIDNPWRCEECGRKDCNFDVDQDCMEKYAGVEPSEQVANRLVAETQLKMEFARKLLDQYGWDFEAALENFLEMKEAGNLPPHIFNDA